MRSGVPQDGAANEPDVPIVAANAAGGYCFGHALEARLWFGGDEGIDRLIVIAGS